MMRYLRQKKIFNTFLFVFLFLSIFIGNGISFKKEKVSSLKFLLPERDAWSFSESPQHYFPETLFEYINGAAEIYLAYDFEELIVGQYKKKGSDLSLSIEIYNMGDQKNSFGIYSAERFPDNQFISIGNHGYQDDGALNFIIGGFYIKLLCFDCDKESESILRPFSHEVEKRVKDKGQLPPLLGLFPEEGLIQNSERFILRNFMGYSFFHDGYLAEYKVDQLEFNCFIIEGKDTEDAQDMLKKYLETKDKQNIQEISKGYHIKDRYYHNIYLARTENYLFGVMKIKDGFEEIGKKYLEALIQANLDYSRVDMHGAACEAVVNHRELATTKQIGLPEG